MIALSAFPSVIPGSDWLPSETSASQLLERLQQLDGFNNEAVIDSMGSTDNNEFICWERVIDQSD